MHLNNHHKSKRKNAPPRIRLKRIAGKETQIYADILRIYLSSSNHPNGEVLLGHIRARNFASLLQWTDSLPTPQLYGSAASYLADGQLSALIRKYPFSVAEVPGLDPESAALKKYMSVEHKLKWVNRKVKAKRRNFDSNFSFWEKARRFIRDVIGDKPNIPRLLDQCGFTAGASVGVHGNATNIARKLLAPRWTCTPTALPYAMTALWRNIHARDCILPGAIKCYDPELFRDLVKSRVEFTSCNKITFVPKTATTHRSIAVEPLLNGFVQSGIDRELRSLLKAKANIDLQDQVVNQTLAYVGSLGGRDPFCTIDLASASDSLSVEVVRDLLPAEWFELLNAVRSPRGSIGGETFHYEKFCSMGNGFCFPLQTLIFASVCVASLKEVGADLGRYSVYGDDIIVPQCSALLVIERLRDIGFSINRDKTFVTGPFRESCGQDWYEGRDVRPVTMTKRLSDVKSLCAFHNSTLRSQWCSDLFTEVRAHLRTYQPTLVRPGIEPGDTAFSVPLDCAMVSPLVERDRELQAWSWVEILSIPRSDKLPHTSGELANVLLYAALSGSNSEAPFTLRYTVKNQVKRISRPYRDVIPEFPGLRLAYVRQAAPT